MGFSFSSIRCGYSYITFLVFVLCVLLTFFATLVDSSVLKPKTEHDGCSALKHFHDYESKCAYLKTIDPCASQGFVDYLSLLYCNFEKFPLLGQSLLFLWLLALFYVLGHTASEYFCSSLEASQPIPNRRRRDASLARQRRS